MDSKVKVRYFDNWEDEGPALFFSSDFLSIKKLEHLFSSLAYGDIKEIEFDSLDFIQPYFGINVIAAAGMQNLGIEKKENSFEWVVTTSEWEKYVFLLSDFREKTYGHQYLETGSDYYYPMQIIVSVKDYPSDWTAWLEE